MLPSQNTAPEHSRKGVELEFAYLLGPYHRPEGEIGHIGGGYGFPDYSWIGVIGVDDKTWYNNRVPDTKRWTDSYMCVALGVQGAKIEIK